MSSSSESSELLITAALRTWSSSRTDRSLSDRKQTAAQISHAAVTVRTLKWGPNRLITLQRLLDVGLLVVSHAWRTSSRICCLSWCVLTHLSCYTNTGLEQIQLIWEHEEHHPKATVCVLKSTLWSFFSVFIAFRPSWTSLCVRSSSSCFRAACLSSWRRIRTTRHGTDWSHGGTLWSFNVLTFPIAAHTWAGTSASCVKLPRSEKACC